MTSEGPDWLKGTGDLRPEPFGPLASAVTASRVGEDSRTLAHTSAALSLCGGGQAEESAKSATSSRPVARPSAEARSQVSGLQAAFTRSMMSW